MPKFNIEKSILVDVPVAKAFAVVRDFNSWNNPHLGGFAAKKQIPISSRDSKDDNVGLFYGRHISHLCGKFVINLFRISDGTERGLLRDGPHHLHSCVAIPRSEATTPQRAKRVSSNASFEQRDAYITKQTPISERRLTKIHGHMVRNMLL